MTTRDIDALIAEYVMGWELSPSGKTWRIPDETGLYKNGWNHKSFVRSWRPSTDPADSKMVRDKMRLDGWNWNARWRGDQKNPLNGLYSAEFWCGTDESHGERHVTEELTIALAALRACGYSAEVVLG